MFAAIAAAFGVWGCASRDQYQPTSATASTPSAPLPIHALATPPSDQAQQLMREHFIAVRRGVAMIGRDETAEAFAYLRSLVARWGEALARWGTPSSQTTPADSAARPSTAQPQPDAPTPPAQPDPIAPVEARSNTAFDALPTRTAEDVP
ncbi:MAG: hypothetical protein ABII82_13865 [Verrucomicrobiota bacterium]